MPERDVVADMGPDPEPRRVLGSRDRAAIIVRIADRQHRLITMDQLRNHSGSSYKVIRRLCRQGWLQPVMPGVFSVGAVPASPPQLALAASLAGGPAVVLSHATAADIHHLPGLARSGELELTAVAPYRQRIRGVTIHQVRSLAAPDVTKWRGVAVTSAPRTLVDLAGRLPEPLLETVVDEGCVRRLWTPRDLCEALERVPRRKGIGPLRQLLQARQDRPRADSLLEARTIRALAGLQPFEVQHQVVLDGHVIVLDLAWPEVKVAGECDGWDVRRRSRRKFDHERRRENLLLGHGWVVAHFTSAMSDQEMVQAVVRLIMARARGT